MQQIKCVRLVADIVVVCAKMDQKSTLGFSHNLIIHIAAIHLRFHMRSK